MLIFTWPFISLIILLAAMFFLTVFWIVDFRKNKVLTSPFLKMGISAIVLILILLLLPFLFFYSAMHTESNMYIKHVNDSRKAEKYYKLAVKTAVIPSVKSDMYISSAIYYKDCPYRFEVCPENFGQKAIDYYEKSNSLEGLFQLCSLYTIKGDRTRALEVCDAVGMKQTIADNYILQNDYASALKIMDEKINGLKQVKCWDYATRAYIHRKLGHKKLFEEDYAAAVKMCPRAKNIKQLYENKNYIQDKYADRKKMYKF